jgi:hypothetical protein
LSAFPPENDRPVCRPAVHCRPMWVPVDRCRRREFREARQGYFDRVGATWNLVKEPRYSAVDFAAAETRHQPAVHCPGLNSERPEEAEFWSRHRRVQNRPLTLYPPLPFFRPHLPERLVAPAAQLAEAESDFELYWEPPAPACQQRC